MSVDRRLGFLFVSTGSLIPSIVLHVLVDLRGLIITPVVVCLIFVLLVASLVLFFLVLRVQSSSDTNERAIRLLVEAFGQERFDWDYADRSRNASGGVNWPVTRTRHSVSLTSTSTV